MSTLSHVTVVQALCPVCGCLHETNELMLHMELKSVFKPATYTGTHQLCQEHQKLYDEGYIALVEIDPTLSALKNNTLKQEDAYRTGKMAHLRISKFEQIFNSPLPKNEAGATLPMVFVEPGIIDGVVASTNP